MRFEGDVKALQIIINVDKEAKNPDSEDGLRAIKCIGAIESIACLLYTSDAADE